MEKQLGESVARFEAALGAFREACTDEAVRERLFADAGEWMDLLVYKLVPHLAGEGCLVAAVAGGTNTGKSTVFNMLLGRDISPMRTTAAATCRPLIAGNALRAAQCLEAKLVPEFRPAPLEDPAAVVERASDPGTIFVVEHEALPDKLVLLDTPDVDSIDQQNWEVAEHIRAAGDILVAVLTGEKYKDDRVIAFFRRAHASGRRILPLMNKANPQDDFAVARQQLRDFCADVGIEGAVCFVVPHDFGLQQDVAAQTIRSLDGSQTLLEHLDSLDVQAIKEGVYHDSVRHMAEQARELLARADNVRDELVQTARDFRNRAELVAEGYRPVPGSAVGGLFHEYVQTKRGTVDKAIGAASRKVSESVVSVSRAITSRIRKSATLEGDADAIDENIHGKNESQLIDLCQQLVTEYYNQAEKLDPPASALVEQGVSALKGREKEACTAAAQKTLRAEDISEAYRRFAFAYLDEWWEAHPGRRQVLMAIDRIVMVTPGAIAGVLAFQTAGVGVAEALVVAGPLAEQVAVRAFEYQFGDKLFGFIEPWQAEQREAFAGALRNEIAARVLGPLEAAVIPFEHENFAAMQRALDQCLKAL